MSPPRQKPGRSKQDYVTPDALIQAVMHRLRIREFTFDFAADRQNRKARGFFSVDEDALSYSPADWRERCADGCGWLNPPFADIAPWAAKCAAVRRRVGSIAFLVPAAVGSNWFRDYVHGQALVLLLNGRLCFIDDWRTTIDPATLKPGKGPPKFYESEPLYPKDCILVLYSPRVRTGYEVWNWRGR